MSIPVRHRANITKPSQPRIYFVTSKTAQGKCLLQSAPMANLLIDVLRQNTAAGKFTVHEFVVMRNHFHALLKVPSGMTVERAVQLIKGGFSYRAKKELGFNGEIWQKGFSDVRITDRETFARRVEYIAANPVKAGYASSAGEYSYGSAHLRHIKNGEAKSAHDPAHGSKPRPNPVAEAQPPRSLTV
ncbi:MAG: REP-associated tyrosine transposase [Candidatus Acidiferrales bacterium]